MRKLICAATIAFSIISVPAYAEEPQTGKGWYGALRAGVADVSDQNFSVTDPAIQLDSRIASKAGPAIGGELGYDLGDLRLGIEAGYQRSKVAGMDLRQLNGTPITPALAGFVQAVDPRFQGPGVLVDGTTVRRSNGSIGRLTQAVFMANATYDIPVNGNLRPYIGAGLGTSHTKLTLLGQGKGSFSFVWQLRAGAALKITDRIDLTADYTYRHSKGGSVARDDVPDGKYYLSSARSSLFALGLRFRL